MAAPQSTPRKQHNQTYTLSHRSHTLRTAHHTRLTEILDSKNEDTPQRRRIHKLAQPKRRLRTAFVRQEKRSPEMDQRILRDQRSTLSSQTDDFGRMPRVPSSNRNNRTYNPMPSSRGLRSLGQVSRISANMDGTKERRSRTYRSNNVRP